MNVPRHEREVAMRNVATALLGLFLLMPPVTPVVHGQTKEEETMEAASRVLREIMAVPLKGIPTSLLADAQAVAVVPGMIKGGLIVGVEHGRGVVIARDKNGAWQSPNFISITGGGIGWQAGLQSTDVVLVFRSRSSVDGLMRGKFTVGADASVAAGPVGRHVSAGTDAQLKSEIYSYSRSRGLFAGIALDGAAVQIDNRANGAFYRSGQQYPQSALNFITQVAAYSNPQAAVAEENQRSALARQLIESSGRLHAVLDAQWQQYLALPPTLADAAALGRVHARFQAVAADPKYRSLAERHEFQETLALLNRYIASTERSPNVLQLPPPPP
jgi:lipid-binding SYLF domain-containing protein